MNLPIIIMFSITLLLAEFSTNTFPASSLNANLRFELAANKR